MSPVISRSALAVMFALAGCSQASGTSDAATAASDAGAPDGNDVPDAAAPGPDAAPASWAVTLAGPTTDDALALALSPEGGAVVAGTTYADGAASAWIGKLDPAGEVAWQRTYGGAGEERANAIRAVAAGGYVVAGTSSSSGAGQADAWVARLDEAGELLWQRTWGGAGADWANAVLPLADGGFLVAGYTESFGAGGRDAWALRLDEGGTALWQRALGGPAMDSFNAVEAVSGGFVLCGFSKSYGESAADEIPDVWLVKLSADGEVVWQQTYGGWGFDYGMAVRATASGDLAVTGWTSSFSELPNSAGAVWVLSLDGDGAPRWQEILDGDNWQEGRGLWSLADGGLIVAGTTWSFGAGGKDVWLLALDDAGAIRWERTYGGGRWDNGHAIELLADGSAIVAGNAMSYSTDGNADVVALKTSPDGTMRAGCAGYGASSQAQRLATTAAAKPSAAAALATPAVGQEGAVVAAAGGLTATSRCGP